MAMRSFIKTVASYMLIYTRGAHDIPIPPPVYRGSECVPPLCVVETPRYTHFFLGASQMSYIIKLIPLVCMLWKNPVVRSIVKRAGVLSGAGASNSTWKQKIVALPVALVVATLGYFVPELFDDALQAALVGGLVGWLAPYVSRVIAYKSADCAENMLLMPVAVRVERSKAWRPIVGSLLDASEEGFSEGVMSDGKIYASKTGKHTGNVRPKTSSKEDGVET